MNYLVNLNDVPWEADHEDGWGADDKFLHKVLASKRIGADLTRNIYGLEGEGLLRYNGQQHRLRPMDVITCPPGPEGAHQIINDTDAPLVYLSIATNDEYEICEYPDSQKVMAYGAGGRLRHLTRKADQVSYMDGEVHPLTRQAYTGT